MIERGEDDMETFDALIARTPGAIQDAQRVRRTVYVDEEGLLPPETGAGGREIDAHDDRDTTVHFIVYVRAKPAGTVRLLVPRPEAEGEIGLDLATKCDLNDLAAGGIAPAEVTRFCVLRRYRYTGVAAALFAGMLAESRRRGITHWVAGANMETDFAEDAALAYRVARAQNLVSGRFYAAPRTPAPACTPRMRPVYTQAERLRAAGGDLTGIALPRTLSVFAKRMGARFVGPPLYDSHFNVFALPLVTALADLATCQPRQAPALAA
jgi:N-acyl-L-homoserine lactone synthetase